MKLLDTNVPIAATDPNDPNRAWAAKAIKMAVAHGGAGLNVVSLAELCSFGGGQAWIIPMLESWGVEFLDLPAKSAEACGVAYFKYASNRKASGPTPAPRIPLPDFFIGAHAEAMGLDLITADERKYAIYFPTVKLETP